MRSQQSGFTLVELLVGALISIIGMILILDTQENFDRNKRSISGGGEAQVAGTVAAFHLERNFRNAGMGFGGATSLGCTVNAVDGGAAFTFPLVPVQIIDGAAGAPDEVRVLYGNSNSPSSTYSLECSEVAPQCSAGKTLLDSRGGIDVNDLVVISAATGCRLVHVSAVNDPAGAIIDHGVGFGRYSGSAAINLVFPAANATIHNLGKQPTINAWTVRNGTLVVANRFANHDVNSWGDMVEGVIDLQAQYGVDVDGDTVVDAWQAAAPADWTRLRLLRFALLVRSQDRERVAATTVAPTWLCDQPAAGDRCSFVMTNVDGTADSGAGGAAANNWRFYRYQVQEVVVPLRNVIWRNAW